MIIDKVRKAATEKSLFSKGDHIVVGISGGPDSVCLLHVLHELAEEWELSLHGVHVNHGIRGHEADLDQAFSENFCQGLRIPCTVFHYDVPSMAKKAGLSQEEMGRNLRYDAFRQVRDTISCLPDTQARIAVAQNRNDQAETVLIRILRGTGTDGLAGMEYVGDGEIIRPLLSVSRSEIEDYCREKDLRPRTDLTNLMPMYARNRIRLELLPLLSSYNSNIVEALCRLSRVASEDRDYFDGQVDSALRMAEKKSTGTKEGDCIGDQDGAICHRNIDRAVFRSLHPAVSKRLIGKVLKEMGLLQDITNVHLSEGDRLIRLGKAADRMDFPGGYTLVLTTDEGRFSHRLKGEKTARFSESTCLSRYYYAINPEGLTEIPELNAALRVEILRMDDPEALRLIRGGFPHDPFRAYLAYDSQMISNLRIRTRKPGDYLTPFGMHGTKKLQDYFVDEKIPSGQRDRIPLLCMGGEILWVVGHRINERFKVKKDSDGIIRLEYIRY